MSSSHLAHLAKRVYDAAHLTGEFTLRSGSVSHEYFDKYQFESDPVLLRDICEQMVPLIPTGTEYLAGLEMGGVAIATVLSQLSGVPCLFVRKSAKQYGTAKFAEGPDYAGKHLTFVEDVVTSGGQIVLSHQDLVNSGALCDQAICVLDREQGGEGALLEAGIQLQSVLKKSDFSSLGG